MAAVNALDRDALEAFVRAADADANDVADCDPTTIAAAATAVRALLAADETADATVPAARKWAEAAGYTTSAADSHLTVADHTAPTAHEHRPETVGHAAASEAYDAVLEYLIAAGPVTRREIVAHVMPEYPLGYTPPPDGESNGGEWWTAVIEPALQLDSTVTHDERAGYLLGDWLR